MFVESNCCSFCEKQNNGKAIKKVIAEEKARNGYLVISDKNGVIKKIAAKDL